MTYAEAIEYLKWKSFQDYTFQDYSGTPYELAIEALEKQIPKKPNYNYSGEPLCPCCQEVMNDGDTICESCHQLIDWSDKSE